MLFISYSQKAKLTVGMQGAPKGSPWDDLGSPLGDCSLIVFSCASDYDETRNQIRATVVNISEIPRKHGQSMCNNSKPCTKVQEL